TFRIGFDGSSMRSPGTDSSATGADALDAEPEAPDAHGCLEDDPSGQLRLPRDAIVKDDRHLDDPGSLLHRPVCGLDLEAVAIGGDAGEVDRLQQLPAPHLEPAGKIPNRHAQDLAGIDPAGPADQLAVPRPPLGRATGDVATTEHELDILGQRLDHRPEILRAMGVVRVQLRD